MMKKNNYFLVFLSLLTIVSIGISVYVFYGAHNSAKSIVYVDLNKIHGEFLLKKELEEKLKDTQRQRKAILDSLGFDLQMLQRKSLSTPNDMNLRKKLEELVSIYQNRQEGFEQDNRLQVEEYDKQIWAQINQYASDFRNSNSNYKMIMGISGSGNIMAADKEFDVSDDLLKYINKKYAGRTGNNFK